MALADVRWQAPLRQRMSPPNELPQVLEEALRKGMAALRQALQIADSMSPDMFPGGLVGECEHGVVQQQKTLRKNYGTVKKAKLRARSKSSMYNQ